MSTLSLLLTSVVVSFVYKWIVCDRAEQVSSHATCQVMYSALDSSITWKSDAWPVWTDPSIHGWLTYGWEKRVGSSQHMHAALQENRSYRRSPWSLFETLHLLHLFTFSDTTCSFSSFIYFLFSYKKIFDPGCEWHSCTKCYIQALRLRLLRWRRSDKSSPKVTLRSLLWKRKSTNSWRSVGWRITGRWRVIRFWPRRHGRWRNWSILEWRRWWR